MNKSQLILSLEKKGFSKDILDAFSKVKREDFVPGRYKEYAYEDTSLPIGKNQTISQPYTIAEMLSLLELKKGQKILEVGSGCGYVLALLSEITGKEGRVFGIELIKELAEKSAENLKDCKNIEIHNRNGNFGLREKMPFDRILISAGIKKIPKNLSLQLKENGIIVAPIGNMHEQSIVSYKKIKDKLKIIKEIPGFIFVPFIIDKK